MVKLFHFIRVRYKLLKRKFKLIPSFCKSCGRNVKDFVAPDEVWNMVQTRIKNGSVLCYECFCEKCGEVGISTVWKLEKLKE